jgi:VCBS repeat-containing protein
MMTADHSGLMGGTAPTVAIATTGVLTFVSAPNFEAPTDLPTPDSVYEVEVTVIDGQGGMDVQTISVTVIDENDSPVLFNNGVMTLPTINEDNIANAGITVANLIATSAANAGDAVTDQDAGSVEGIAINAASGSVGGTWQYSTDGGTNFVDLGIVSGTASRLLRAIDLVRYVPDQEQAETATITFRAWDQTSGVAGGLGNSDVNGGDTAFSLQEETAAIDVTDVNDAPVLSTLGMALLTITEDDVVNAGQTVDSILLAGGDPITDVDPAPIEGIAINGLSGRGTWQYSINGGTDFFDVGTVSNTAALLLRGVDLVRFVPDTFNGETATIQFRAWDQSGTSAGPQGTTVSVLNSGGVQPFSTATATASITVTDFNDAPVANLDEYETSEDNTLTVSGLGVRQNDFDVDLPAQTLTVVDPQLILHSDEETVLDVIAMNANGTFSYDPTNSVALQSLREGDSVVDRFRYRLQDNGTNPNDLTSNEATVEITVHGVNDNPVALNRNAAAIEDGGAINGTFSASDIDEDATVKETDLLVYTISSQPAAGSVYMKNMPGVLMGDEGDTQFTFDPGTDFQDLNTGEMRDVTFSYKATDLFAGESNTATVTVTVTGVNDRPEVEDISITTTEDGPVTTDLFVGSDAEGNDLRYGLRLSMVMIQNCAIASPTDLTDNFTDNGNGSFTFDSQPTTDFDVLSAGESCQVVVPYFAEDLDSLGNVISTSELDATITITVNGLNDAPIAGDDARVTTEDQLVVVGGFPTDGILSLVTEFDFNDDADVNKRATIVSFDTRSILGAVVSVQPDGGYTYDPNPSATLQALKVTSSVEVDSFRVTIEDFHGVQDTAIVRITVSGLNDAPVANPDFGATTEDHVLNVNARGVLANDTDPDEDETNGLSAQPAVSLSSMGAMVEVFGDGSYTYNPQNATDLQALRQGEIVNDTFSYIVIDVNGEAREGMVTISVSGVNDAPVANDDNANSGGILRNEDTAFLINALTNDTDPDTGDMLSLVRFDALSAQGAAITVNVGGAFVYDPRGSAALQALSANLTVPDTFTYEISDGLGVRATATVSVTVTGVNDRPVAFADAYSTTEDRQLYVPPLGVLANDRDEEGDILTVFTVNGGSFMAVGDPIELPSGAQLILNVDGSFDYDPTTSPSLDALRTGASVADSFFYDVYDGFDRSSPATVVITVTGVNDAPVARDQSYATNEDALLTVSAAGLLTNDTDVDGDPIAVNAFVGVSSRGAAISINADGSFQYDPRGVAGLQALSSTQTQAGTLTFVNDTFTYSINDGRGGVATATATITVQGENDPPIATDDFYQVDEDSVLIVSGQGVIENDLDVDNDDVITVVTFDVTSALGAPVVVNSDGTFTYDPTNIAEVQALPLGQILQDTFTYRVTDGKSQSNQAVVTVTVSGRNDAPIVRNDTYSVEEDGRLLVSAADGVLNNPATGDSDPEGSPLTAALITVPTNGQISFSVAGALTYTPNPDFSGVDSFTYRASDGSISSDLATVTIVVIPVNDDPAATSDNYAVDQEGSLSVSVENGLLANDLDVDGEALTAELVPSTGPSNGSLQLAGDGSFVYTPNPGFFGDDTFQYDAVDGSGARARATVTIAVNNIHAWQNPLNRFDVNADGTVSALDVLIIINFLNQGLGGPVPINAIGPPFRDVNGSDFVTPADVLVLVNRLNQITPDGEGESGQSALQAEGEAPIIFLPGMAADGISHTAGGQLELAANSRYQHAQTVDELFGDEVTAFALAPRKANSTDQSVDMHIESLFNEDFDDDLFNDIGNAWEDPFRNDTL